MKRRALLACLGGAIAIRPCNAFAQQPRVPTVGVLVIGKPDPALMLRTFRGALRKLGYVEGLNIRLDIRSADGDLRRLPALADELARDRVDVMATWMTPAVLAAKRATSSIPIVMIGAADPVGMGIVKSLARPGANVTGVAGMTADLAGKLVELLKEMLPGVTRIAALCNAADPFSKPYRERIEAAGKTNGIEIAPLMVNEGAELDAAFPQMIDAKIASVIVQPSLPLAHAAELALQYRLPAASPLSPFARAGGLLSYSTDPQVSHREAAVFVDKVLKGANPADLPVEQPDKFELVINLGTANALGLTVPQSLLARATEVIE